MMDRVVIITGVVIGTALLACSAICGLAMARKIRKLEG